nr:NAC domain-containing protein 7-like [Coffea arabica]XP_027126111.1 NAC domain-containing protein 7-like [Coffea arabica]
MIIPKKYLLEWIKFVPIGYKFVPSDYELLKYYLLPKVRGGFTLPAAGLGIIREADVYQSHPANLPGLDKGEASCYFFTTRDLRYENSERTARTTKDGRGHWRMTSKRTPLFEADRSNLGRKNTLVYHLTKPPGPGVPSNKDLKTNWIMHEFVLDRSLYDCCQIPSASTNKLKQVVLCRIYERNKAEAEQEKSRTDQDSTSLRIRDAGDSSAGIERRETCTKRKQRPTSTPEKGTSSCNHHKSVALFDQEGLPSGPPKRSRLVMVEQDESRMRCKEENGLEGNSRNDEEEDVQSRIGCIEDNESGHLMASVNQEEEEEEFRITTMNGGHIEEGNESSQELHPANAGTEENSTASGDCFNSINKLAKYTKA